MSTASFSTAVMIKRWTSRAQIRSTNAFRCEGFSTLKQIDDASTFPSKNPTQPNTDGPNGSAILSAAERLIDETYKTSGRKRRRRLYDPRQRRQNANGINKVKSVAKLATNKVDDDKNNDDGFLSGLTKPPGNDTRTVMDLIFPNPYKNEPLPTKEKQWPRNLSEWRTAFSKAWALYRWTWRGFFTSRGFLVEDELDRKLGGMVPNTDGKTTVTSQTDEIIDNVRKNTDFVKKEAMKVRQTLQETTGIETKEDIKRWVAEGMKLFTECVQEFMAGYRKGRDDEVEKMLTEYFQNLEDKVNAPKRRKIKVRVRNRIQRRIHRRYLRKCR